MNFFVVNIMYKANRRSKYQKKKIIFPLIVSVHLVIMDLGSNNRFSFFDDFFADCFCVRNLQWKRWHIIVAYLRYWRGCQILEIKNFNSSFNFAYRPKFYMNFFVVNIKYENNLRSSYQKMEIISPLIIAAYLVVKDHGRRIIKILIIK